MTTAPNDLVTKQEAVKMSGKSYSTLSRWIDEGKVQKYRIGNRVHLSKSELLNALVGNLREHNEKTSTPATLLTITGKDEQSKRATLSSFEPQNELKELYERMLSNSQKQIEKLEERNQQLIDTVDSLTKQVSSQAEKILQSSEKIFQLDTILKSLPKFLTEEATSPKIEIEKQEEEEPVPQEEPVEQKYFPDEKAYGNPSGAWSQPPEEEVTYNPAKWIKRKAKNKVRDLLGI